MTIKDGLGSFLQVGVEHGWVIFYGAVRLKTLLIGYVVQFLLTYVAWKWWKGRKSGKA